MQISFSNIEELLRKLEREKHFFLEDVNWIEPIGIAILKQFQIKNTPKEIRVKGNMRAVTYINTMLQSEDGIGKKYTPLEHFDQSGIHSDRIASDIVETIIASANGLSQPEQEDFAKYLNYMISEMMDNVTSHARSENGGFVTAQYYPSYNKVQVVIIDGGVGLLNTLIHKFPLKDEKAAIKLAMEKEITGSNAMKPYLNVPKHAGLGLFFLSNIIKHTGGKLIIVSNNTIYRFPENTYTELDTDFEGTIIAFELYESKLEYNFSELFNIIRNEEDEEEEEDFFS